MTLPKPLRSTFQQSVLAWLLAIATGVSLMFTVAFASALSSSTGEVSMFITAVTSPPEAVRILRILSEVTSILLAALVVSAFKAIMWTAASSQKGLAVSTLLSITPTTGIFGLLHLLRWKAAGRHYLTTLMRLAVQGNLANRF